MKQLKLKKKWIIIGVVGLVAVLGIGSALMPKKEKAPSVKLSKITRGDIEKAIEVNGNVEAQDSAEITTQYNYEVIKINVKEGDPVTKGQVLASLNQKDLLDEITLLKKDIAYEELRLKENYNSAKDIYTSTQSLQLALDNAKMAYNTAMDNEKKQKDLFDAGAVAKQEYDNAVNATKQAKISYEQAEESLRKGKIDINNSVKQSTPKQSAVEALNIKKTTLSQKMDKLNALNIKSPINGTVTRVYAKLGRNAKDTENNKPMFIIEDSSKKYISAKVGEYDISNIKLGQEVKITAEVLGGATAKGIVSRISPTGEKTANSNNIAIPVKILVTQNDPRLITGVTAKARIKIKEEKNVLKTQFENIYSLNKQDYVFAVENGVLKKIQITKGLESDFETQITSDKIKEGMEIVQSPDDTLVDGEKVTINKDETMPTDKDAGKDKEQVKDDATKKE